MLLVWLGHRLAVVGAACAAVVFVALERSSLSGKCLVGGGPHVPGSGSCDTLLHVPLRPPWIQDNGPWCRSAYGSQLATLGLRRDRD